MTEGFPVIEMITFWEYSIQYFSFPRKNKVSRHIFSSNTELQILDHKYEYSLVEQQFLLKVHSYITVLTPFYSRISVFVW